MDKPLTLREVVVMRMTCDGFSAEAIASATGKSSRTIEHQRKTAASKLGAVNGVHAAVLFDRMERVETEEPTNADQ